MTIQIAIKLSVLFTVVYTNIVTNSLNRKMALQVLKIGPTNMVVSSLAMRFTMCKLASVAEGETKSELLSVLGYSQDKMVDTCYEKLDNIFTIISKYSLLMLNKIYVNYSDDINNTFVKDPKRNFGVLVEKVGFNYPTAVSQHINRYFSAYTLKRIQDVIEANDINNETSMLIISGLHFRGRFEFPFDIAKTKMRKFHLHNTTKIVQTPMMTHDETYLYLDDVKNQFRMLKMNYVSLGASITFVVPYSNSGLPQFLEKLYANPDILKHARSRMRWKVMTVYLPKFKIKTYVDWTGFLQEMGLIKIFDKNTTGLKRVLNKNSQNKTMSLNSAKQKVFFELDEVATVQTAEMKLMASMGYTTTSYSQPLNEFEADRPFYYIVTLEDGNEVHDLFNGVYYGPQ